MAEDRDDDTVFWVDPPMRGVIFANSFHIPKKFAKFRRNFIHNVRIDTCFRRVMEGCAAAENGREDTWISDPIIESYCTLHQRGVAHSFEIFQNETLIGGLYGLSIGSAFFGESMFGTQTGASKLALCASADHLFAAGYEFIDTQFWTQHLDQFGCLEIEKEAYLSALNQALSVPPSSAVFGKTA